MASARYNTALSFLEIFEALSLESHQSLFSHSYRHDIAPSSISLPPTMDSGRFAAHLASLRDVLKAFPVTAKDIIEDERANRVVIRATSEAQFHDHVKDDGISDDDWTYTGEYIFIFDFDETGRKIDHVLEFLDSKGSERMRELVKRARGNK